MTKRILKIAPDEENVFEVFEDSHKIPFDKRNVHFELRGHPVFVFSVIIAVVLIIAFFVFLPAITPW